MSILNDKPNDDFTIDAFHRGAFHLKQPARKGHRAGIDAMLLAASLSQDTHGRGADLGAGAGAVAFAIAARLPKTQIDLVEIAPDMIYCAHETMALKQNGAFKDRLNIIESDISLRGQARVAAGLHDNSYDFIVTNPPFNERYDRQTPHALKAQAHVMNDGLFESWLRSAAALLKSNGTLALIARPSSLHEILSALDKRFGNIELKPIHPRAEQNAIRIIIRARLGSKAPLTFHPALILHEGNEQGFTPLSEAICNGQSALFDD